MRVLLRMNIFTFRNWLFVKRCVPFIRFPEQCSCPIHSGAYTKLGHTFDGFAIYRVAAW